MQRAPVFVFDSAREEGTYLTSSWDCVARTGAGSGPVGGDVGGAQPRPVDVPEQVVLDADLGIVPRDVDGGLRGGGIG